MPCTCKLCTEHERLCAPCGTCGAYSDPRHVVETSRVDRYGALVRETKCYCPGCCPVCKEAPNAL